MRRSRRITLIDMLLLAVMAGVLVPWLLGRVGIEETAPYRIRISAGSGGSGAVVLRVSLPIGEDAPADGEIVGWVLYGPDGAAFHEEADLAPTPGGRRVFVADAGDRETVRCEIRIGDRTVVRQLTMGEP